MYIDIVAIVEILAMCVSFCVAAAQLWFYGYGALWFYRNTKDKPKEEE